MGKINAKKVIIAIIIVLVIVVIALITTTIVNNIIINKQMKTAKHAVTLVDNVEVYSSKTKKKKTETLEIGTDTYILESITNKDGDKLYKIKTGKKVGYVSQKDIGYYTEAKDDKELMVDVSQFNLKNNFKSIGQFKAFLINNNIKYVYIRAGGRGYGQAGKFYYDDNYKEYADACEYLNVPFGFYFLEEAITSEEVDEEVKFISNFLEENKYNNNVLPVALDVEKHVEAGRADGIWETRYELINELINKLQKKKIDSILYSNAVLASTYLTKVNAKMWLAYYPETDSIPYSWDMLANKEEVKNTNIMDKLISWQFTETGVKNKISEKVDISTTKKNFYKEDKSITNFFKISEDVLKMIDIRTKITELNIFKFNQ